ncbi:hypothetical protein GNI_147820 [Gregarina niphandrodes]|uniref:Armadillo/beta-catenin-like repeat protein n=1 Tax=Gregarina niphandrodes TaxID=110365 RepID=A0A023B078_GRENI|nr:hypothetical protein GNI_147820 [Gregarina niphandrodes]EZG44394.1 hypothetical protein GNI_147820 [Gregarina niphandrodes]|eukprot:XP_011132672.1 hypothetical protein GNI_147820 [Gregarina niphandrodes]
MITEALEHVRSYPAQIAVHRKTEIAEVPAEGDQPVTIGKIQADVDVILQHLKSHTELKHYVDEAQALVELLGALYHGWLVPLYRTAPKSKTVNNDEESKEDVLEESIPNESAPNESAPIESASDETAPKVSEPEENAPKESVPERSVDETELQCGQDETTVCSVLQDKAMVRSAALESSAGGGRVGGCVEGRQETVREIEAAIGGLLDCLTVLCVETEEDAGDVQGSRDCRDRRQVVRKAVPASLLSQLAEAMVRKGVDETARRACVEAVMVLARALGSLDEEYWLRVCRLGAECVECPRVRTRALAALGVMLQSKLALGTKTSVVKVGHELSLVTSTVIDILNEEGAEEREYVDFVLSAILRLLGDEERSAQDAVDWPSWLGQLLDGRLAADEELCGALGFLNLLHSAAPNEFATYVSLAGLAFRVLPLVCKAAAAPLRTQTEAAAFLSHCLDFPSLRKQLLEAEAVDLLAPALDRADDPELRAAVVAALAKLAFHGAEAKDLVLDSVPFYSLVHTLAQHIRTRVGTGSDRTESDRTESEGAGPPPRPRADQGRLQRIARSVVSTLASLSFHAEFKARVLRLASLEELERVSAEYDGDGGGDGGTETRPLLKPGSRLDAVTDKLLAGAAAESAAAKDVAAMDVLEDLQVAAAVCPVQQGALDVVLTVFNVLRSRHDRKVLSNSEKRGPDLDASQLKELEAMYHRLPEQAKVAERRLYDSGGLVAAMAVRKYVLMRTGLVQALDGLLEHGRWSGGSGGWAGGRAGRSLCVLASHSVCCLASVLGLRAKLVAAGGLRVLLRGCEQGDVEARFQVCSLVATCPPRALGYAVRMRCAHELLQTVGAEEEELPVCFAARGLVNLCALFEDVSVKIWDGGRGWRTCENLMTDWSDLTSRYGAELLCNLTSKDAVQQKLQALILAGDTDASRRWPLSLLVAFASDASVPERQYACLSTLYHLSGPTELAVWVFNQATVEISGQTYLVLDRVLEIWSVFGQQDAQVELRVVCTVINVLLNNLQFVHALGQTPTADSRELLTTVELNSVKTMLATGMLWNALSDAAKTRFTRHFHEFVREPTYRQIVARLPGTMQTLWTSF